MSADPDQIRQLLKAEDFGERIKAINQLREIDPALAFELIQPLCDDPNTRVRYAAVSQISTLGEQDKPTALKVLTASLGDPEPDVQAAAADALGALKLTESLDDLKELYGMTSEWLVQMSIVASLGEMGGIAGDSRAFNLLKSALASDNSLVRVSAIGALGELQDNRALPLLLPYVDSQDWQERHRTAQALSHFLGSDSTHDESNRALQKLAQDESEVVAETAESYLSS